MNLKSLLLTCGKFKREREREREREIRDSGNLIKTRRYEILYIVKN